MSVHRRTNTELREKQNKNETRGKIETAREYRERERKRAMRVVQGSPSAHDGGDHKTKIDGV
jgi:hypothetical protein